MQSIRTPVIPAKAGIQPARRNDGWEPSPPIGGEGRVRGEQGCCPVVHRVIPSSPTGGPDAGIQSIRTPVIPAQAGIQSVHTPVILAAAGIQSVHTPAIPAATSRGYKRQENGPAAASVRKMAVCSPTCECYNIPRSDMIRQSAFRSNLCKPALRIGDRS